VLNTYVVQTCDELGNGFGGKLMTVLTSADGKTPEVLKCKHNLNIFSFSATIII
jgi:hypothetical protein